MKSIDAVRSKIIGRESLAEMLEKARKKGEKIIFTNGCFDILHRGHIEYLSNASDLGDIFIIGLNSDDSVRRLKGESRPAVDEESRALTLASFEFVDYVVLFSEDTPYELLQALLPDVLVKGGDYTDMKDIIGYDIVLGRGGEVLTMPFVDGYSTTDIYERIQGTAKK
jgi:rfaE bifunctional protein nucleotidyltransferase chain/domain